MKSVAIFLFGALAGAALLGTAGVIYNIAEKNKKDKEDDEDWGDFLTDEDNCEDCDMDCDACGYDCTNCECGQCSTNEEDTDFVSDEKEG